MPKKILLWCSTVITLLLMATTSQSADSTWDESQQLLLVRGISVMGSNDSRSFNAVMSLADISQGTMFFELKELNYDTEPGQAIFYAQNNQLVFPINIEGTWYEVAMQMQQGDTGTIFFYVTSIAPNDGGGEGGGDTTSQLSGCFLTDERDWMTYYCYDGNGHWYTEDWNAISGCTGTLDSGTYQIQGSTLTQCNANECGDYPLEARENGVIINGEYLSQSNGC